MVWILGVEAAGWHELHQYWWQYVNLLVAVGEHHTHSLLGLDRIHSCHPRTRNYIRGVPHSNKVLR